MGAGIYALYLILTNNLVQPSRVFYDTNEYSPIKAWHEDVYSLSSPIHCAIKCNYLNCQHIYYNG